jgi:ribose/xylose/arabinose/galactoside ABC-type transport system permease subunit
MPEAAPDEQSMTRGRGALYVVQRIGPVWIAVVLLYVVSGLISPAMFKGSQVLNILQVSAFLGTVALGQTVALLVGGIDLSVAGVVTLTNIVVASVMAGETSRMPLAIAVCAALATGVGLINGLLVAVVRITPLIVTLATNSILFGAALVYTKGAPHGSVSSTFATLGQGHLAGFPVSTICWIVVAVVTAWLLRGTSFGRKLYAVGANPRAARVMGVRVGPMLISAYVMSSLLAAVGGLLLTAYIGLPSLGIGDQFLLTSIAAPVVGGTMLTGGVGSILGTVGGTLFMTELNSFTTIIKVSTGGQYILQGIIIAVGVMLYPIVSGRRGRG